MIQEKKAAFIKGKSILSPNFVKPTDDAYVIKKEKEVKGPFLKDDLDDDMDVGEILYNKNNIITIL